MAAVPAKYPPPVPVRRTGAQPTAKRTPQNVAIPLKPVLSHATEYELDEKPRMEESPCSEEGPYRVESIVREKLLMTAHHYDQGQDYPREVEYENIPSGRCQVKEERKEIELLEEPIAQQSQPLLSAPESTKPGKSRGRGPSVFEITQKDADSFKPTDEPSDDEGDAESDVKSLKARELTPFIKIILCISICICLWPFSCICLCCAYCISLRVSASTDACNNC